jgi:UDPglucose 6-dehydrogenase
MRIAMVGTGYVGLVSGACFSDFGHDVTCIDKDADKIAALRQGRMPIFEPGLEDLVERNVRGGRLSFTTDLEQGVAEAEAVFIAVGTPARRGDGHADLSYVFGAAEEIGRAMKGPAVVVTKSTVPVGTGDRITELLKKEGAPAGTTVASNPEFLREIYRPLFLNKAPILFTGRRTAELTKYAANAFLAVKISFINEIANLCEAVGADVQEVARGIGLDNRIGPKFLHPGPGYGGSCFPKDTLALLQTAQSAGVEQKIVSTVVAVNDERKKSMAGRVRDALGGSVEGKRIGVLGLAFKPNTDDMRDAPSIPLVTSLVEEGAEVIAFDPAAMNHARPMLPGMKEAASAEAVAEGADALVIVTEWDEFRALDLETIARQMRGKVLVDLRNVYDPEEAERAGLDYRGIGRAARPKSRLRDAAE